MPNAPLRALGAAAPGPRVAYQGEPGAFGEAAIVQHWRGAAVPVGARTFADVLALLVSRRVDEAALPVSNSAIGPITAAQEVLYENAARVEVVDEIVVPVQHALIALPGASLATVRAVGSHPAALAQCAGRLEAMGVTVCEAFDTAGAARQLAALVGGASMGLTKPWYAGLPGAAPETLAAIASEMAAERHGLVVLARSIQDDATNETRFAVLRRRAGERTRW
jgi:prephenate dehydratase